MTEGTPSPVANKSWLFSESARQAIQTSANLVTRAELDKVRKNLEFEYDDNRDSVNVVTEREFPFFDLDESLFSTDPIDYTADVPRRRRPYISRTPSNVSLRGEFSLTSYESDIFDPNEVDQTQSIERNSENDSDHASDFEGTSNEITDQRSMMRTPPEPTAALSDTEESVPAQAALRLEQQERRQSRTTVRANNPAAHDSHRDNLLHELVRDINELRIQVSRLTMSQTEAAPRTDHGRVSHEIPANSLDMTYGRSNRDVRSLPNVSTRFLSMKEARNMIPEIDGTSRHRVRQFLNASTYAMQGVHPADEISLLQAILCTKLAGKAMMDFHTRDIQNFEQLKRELETEYLGKRSTAHLQMEFNTLKQKTGESAQFFGHRVEKIAMELYESMEEGKNHTSEQQRAILDNIKEQALHNYQIGLHDNIKLIVRAQRYNNLLEAIAAASAEEKVITSAIRSGYTNRKYDAPDKTSFRRTNNYEIKCIKCNKIGHTARECRSRRYTDRFTLPKPEERARINTVNAYCNYCKKQGHTRNECWSLHGRPTDKREPEKRNGTIPKTKKVHTVVTKEKSQSEYEASSTDSSEEEGGQKILRARAARKHQVSQVTKQHDATSLRLITLNVKEMKKEKVNLLLDTGATLTLIKVGKLKGDTLIKEKPTTLTGVTGHHINTIGKTKATILIGDQKIRHTMHVVRDDFPIEYEGILGMDFLQKHRTKSDQKRFLQVNGIKIKLHPYKRVTLNPRSETIIEAVTDKNTIGFIKREETQPGVFIGNCLVMPREYTCPISILNTTEEHIHVSTPLVTVEEIEIREHQKAFVIQEEYHQDNTTVLERQKQILKNLNLEHLNKEEQQAIELICAKFSDIFHLEGDALTYTTAVTHKINTRTDSAPVNVRPYRLPEKHKTEVDNQIRKMLNEEIIRPSISQWNAPLLVVPKKADASGKQKLRIVVDFRKLNELTIGDAFPIPNITDILDQLGNARYFSTLDLASGYHQIPMEEKHKEKTAFSTQYGHYEFNRMPFGLKNAPATFQRLMNTILAGIQGLKCLVYLDDIVIYGSTLEEHNKRLIEVLQKLRKYKLKLQPDKCQFLRKEVTYLGHIITEDGIRPDPGKISAIKNFPTPKKPKDIQSFLGLAGYYRKFISEFSKTAKPLSSLLKKEKKFEWTPEQQNAFEILKSKLITAPILSYPDFTQEFLVTTDASDYAIGAVLSQGTVGQDKPIAYASRILNKAECNYNTTEKELLAIVWAVKYFRPYLYGTTFTIITDHRPLTWLFNVKDPGSRLIRWRLKLEEYEYKIIYKQGKRNTNADALSRNPIQPTTTNETKEKETQINTVQQNQEKEEERTKQYTEEEKRQILYEYHDAPTGGHQGIERTLNRIRLKHNWHGITKDIERYIAKCELCQRNKLSRRIKAPLIITDTPNKPFEKCALDIVGPLTVTNNGNKYILTFQDNLSKFSKAIAIQNQEANTISKEFVTKIVLEHGIPETVLTDQGTNFLSDIFKNTCKLLKIDKIQTTAYHPESNGALERSHRTLAEYLRHYINEDQTDWDEWIPYAMFAYNTTPHTATGYTPFELIYGHQANLPTALLKPPKPTYNYEDYAQELRERLRATNQQAKEHVKEEKIKTKIQHDKKAKPITFKVGEKVLLYDETLRRGRSKKLDSLWTGPYIIIKKNSEVNYTIKKGRKLTRVHVNRLKSFIDN